MPRTLLLVLFSLFLAAAAHAQSADVSVEFEFTPEEHLTASGFSTWVRITNNGPDDAHDLTITADAPGARAVSFWRTSTRCEVPACTTTYGDLKAGAYVEFGVAFELPGEIETSIPLTVRVSSATPDPKPENNVASQTEQFFALPQLYATISANSGRLEPQRPAVISFGASNVGRTAATGATLDITLPAGSSVISIGPPAGVTCTSTPMTIHCDAGTLQPYANVTVNAEVLTPAIYEGGSLPITVTAGASNRVLASRLSSNTTYWYFAPLFVVDNAADSGPGSLRQAMIDANARCTSQCRIGFRIPLTDGAPVTIKPAAPLPAITSSISIDGVSENDFAGQLDVKHPLVTIDGSLLKAGDGFDLRADGSAVSGLAIGNFPGNGITVGVSAVQSYPRTIADNFIGTDALGRTAMPNERGIVVHDVRYGGIVRNVISGNRRSGIWLIGTYLYAVEQNRIGVAANGVTPLPNGASGIYVAPFNERPWIRNNTIAYNREFGIAVHPSVRTIDAATNSIFANGNFGIDYGLDLATPNAEMDLGRQPNTPVLTSARYNAATNETTIEGDLRSFVELPTGGDRLMVNLFANDDTTNPQAQQLIGSLITRAGHVTLTVRGDLRGKAITGITKRYRLGDAGTLEEYPISEETSEISAGVVVE